MPSPLSHELFSMCHLRARTDLSTEFESTPSETLRRIQGPTASDILLNSEAAVFPMACDPCSSGLNQVSSFDVQGERKESIHCPAETHGESNQFESKNRVNDALLKPPNTVGIEPINDFGWQCSIQAGEQVMACGAVGAARGYYAV